MNILSPLRLPYDPAEWAQKPFAERARMVCEAWALQGYGSPLGVYGFYALKVVIYIVSWAYFCSLTPGFGGMLERGSAWLSPVAFQKAIVWSMVFEGLGLGCGSGPLTGRYLPPIGGVLYFARPGTTKLALFPRLPLLGGVRRTWFDAGLYVLALALMLRALFAPAITPALAWPIVLAVALLGVCDKTLFLAFRSEHYWTTCVCFALTPDWIAGAKAVQLALWFWAGVSKLNPHFPAVVCVMTSNSPFTQWAWLRKRMYRDFPNDLRPSRVAVTAAHMGASLEFAVPSVLLFASGGTWLVIGMALMLLLHTFITSNVPMGAPIEWNFMVVYGGFALFWAHPDVSLLQLHPWPLTAALVVMLVVVPALGNFFPAYVPFLLAMRFYAGNWAYGVWLFKRGSTQKLERLTKSAAAPLQQLGRLYDPVTAQGLLGKVMAFRLMHLHGRALPLLIPQAVERFEDREYLDGEIIAGLALGWNFGDGHLHDLQLVQAIQAQCGFEPGELRCIFVESQPLFGRALAYQIVDASTGVMSSGSLPIDELMTRQPWSAVA
jgi:hypothetical protein